MAKAVRNTLALVAFGAVGIVTYGYFVVNGGRPDPRAAAEARAIEAVADTIAAACMHAETPPPLAGALDDRVIHAEAECGIERDPGSGIATTTIQIAPIGEHDTQSADWNGDPASRRCAGAVTLTCTGVFAHRSAPDHARIVRVRRFSNGWARVEAIVRLN